jgi:hypothetical protein
LSAELVLLKTNNGSSEPELIPVSVALNNKELYSPWTGCGSIADYLPSYYWYPFILLGQEKLYSPWMGCWYISDYLPRETECGR